MPKAFSFYEKVSHRHEWSVWTTCRQLWALSPLVLSACRYYTKRIRSRTLECLIADDEHRNDLGKTFAMSVPSGLQTVAYQDDDINCIPQGKRVAPVVNNGGTVAV